MSRSTQILNSYSPSAQHFTGSATAATFLMMWLAHHVFSSIEGTEYLLLCNNLEYLGPNPSWISDFIQPRRSFVPLQWKISLRAKSISINENQILHLNVFSLVRKEVRVPSVLLLPSCSVSDLTWLSVFGSPLLGRLTPQLRAPHGEIHLLHTLQVTHLCIKKKASVSFWLKLLIFILHSGSRLFGDPAQSSTTN